MYMVAYTLTNCLRAGCSSPVRPLPRLSHRRFMHPSDDPSDGPAVGGEPSSQAFRASRMLVQEMPCFVFDS
jgi:hypothetical protein